MLIPYKDRFWVILWNRADTGYIHCISPPISAWISIRLIQPEKCLAVLHTHVACSRNGIDGVFHTTSYSYCNFTSSIFWYLLNLASQQMVFTIHHIVRHIWAYSLHGYLTASTRNMRVGNYLFPQIWVLVLTCLSPLLFLCLLWIPIGGRQQLLLPYWSTDGIHHSRNWTICRIHRCVQNIFLIFGHWYAAQGAHHQWRIHFL